MPFFVSYSRKSFALAGQPILPRDDKLKEEGRLQPRKHRLLPPMAACGTGRRTVLDATACCLLLSGCYFAVAAAVVVADAARRMVAVKSLRHRPRLWTDLGLQLIAVGRTMAPRPDPCDSSNVSTGNGVGEPMTMTEEQFEHGRDGAVAGETLHFVLVYSLDSLRGKKETAGAALATTDRGPNQLRRAILDVGPTRPADAYYDRQMMPLFMPSMTAIEKARSGTCCYVMDFTVVRVARFGTPVDRHGGGKRCKACR
jgi:hypothetical protein